MHQAVGMTVAQLTIGPADALAILRAHAFAEGTSLDSIATDVVERRLDFTNQAQGVIQHRPEDISGNGDS